MRALILGAVFVVAGCQCFSPVGEEDGGVRTDGGQVSTGGGTGGGASGGGGATGGGGVDGGPCVTENDCPGGFPAIVTQCGGADGAWTCAFGACVPECANGRTCIESDAGCITCNGGTQQCLTANNCTMMTRLEIESSTCGLPLTTLTAFSLSSLPCSYGLTWPDGGSAGSISFYGFNDVTANIPELGGKCIGRQLPTGALRYGLGCPNPSCMLSVMPLN